ncbi:MAG: YSC84-related protein [Dissulfurispiraceae bacterium]
MKKRKTKEEKTMRERKMRVAMLAAMVLLCLGLSACASAPMSQSKKDEQQASVRDMASQTLANLYKANPAAQGAIENSAGYAVFSDAGFKFMFMGGQKGAGIAVNNAAKQEIFMKMMELQPGIGLGAEKFRVVFVFDTSDALNKFVTSGWEFGANAMAAAKTKTNGGAFAGAVTVSEGVHMYQLTEAGAIVGVSITGAKYYKDSELN